MPFFPLDQEDDRCSPKSIPPPRGAFRGLARPLALVCLFLVASTLISLWVGYRPLDLSLLREDEVARSLFFRLRLPRVVLAGILGASLGAVGACLQAFFRNPLAEPFTLGVSGGGTLGQAWPSPWVGAPTWRACPWFFWQPLRDQPVPSWWSISCHEAVTWSCPERCCWPEWW